MSVKEEVLSNILRRTVLLEELYIQDPPHIADDDESVFIDGLFHALEVQVTAGDSEDEHVQSILLPNLKFLSFKSGSNVRTVGNPPGADAL